MLVTTDSNRGVVNKLGTMTNGVINIDIGIGTHGLEESQNQSLRSLLIIVRGGRASGPGKV